MVLSKEQLKVQIDACKAAIKTHREGEEVNKVVLEAFENELKKNKK